MPVLLPAAEPSAPGPDAQTGSSYQDNYQSVERAARYNEKYRRQAFKRWSTHIEFSLIRRLLSKQGHSDVLLEVPSGGGRLSPQIAPYTDLLIESDIGLGQLVYGRASSTLQTPQLWFQASALRIPLQDDSVDGTLCVRLSHHLPSATEREQLLDELLRVSKRFVIMTYFDYNSIKNMLRRARRPWDGKKPKMTMTTRRVRELASRQGFVLTASPPLSRLFSGHRYALMVKSGR